MHDTECDGVETVEDNESMTTRETKNEQQRGGYRVGISPVRGVAVAASEGGSAARTQQGEHTSLLVAWPWNAV